MKITTALFTLLILFTSTTFAQVVSSTPEKTFQCGKSRVTCFAVSPRGDQLLIGLGEYAELWDIDKGKRIYVFKHEEQGIKSIYHVMFNDNGEFAVTIDLKGKRKVWDVKSGKERKRIYDKDIVSWLIKDREVKALGLSMKNTEFEYYYLQKEAAHPSAKVTAKGVKGGTVQFVGEDGKSLQDIKDPDNRDKQHIPPCFFDGGYFITGTDKGVVNFYKAQ